MKKRFLERLQRELVPLKLPIGAYTIAGSGPLVIRNIRKAVDIDVLVKRPLWETLSSQYSVHGKTGNLITIGTVEIWKDWMSLSHRIDEMIDESDLIEGFPFMRLSDTMLWKEHLNRPKDLQDIELIQAYLSAQQQGI